MTDPLLATPLGKEAVEELARRLSPDGGYCACSLKPKPCRGCVEDAEAAFAAALPKLRAALAEESADLTPLARLGLWLLDSCREGYVHIDGGDVQDRAVAFGVIAPVQVAEPCDPDHCLCAECDNFPGECFRNTEATVRAFAALASYPVEGTRE